MLDETPTVRERFGYGFPGALSFWALPAIVWMIKKFIATGANAPLPAVGPYYVFLFFGALLATVLWGLMGAAWSTALPAHAKWLAWYHGAAAPHSILFIIGGNNFLASH